MPSMDLAKDPWRPETDAEKQQVRDQLRKVLDSPQFLSSKRYPNMLRFVVEQTLEGQEDSLKERLLGIEVFRRPADYDTNQDPVVRLSAAEVRKRLALYYQQAGHQNELLIGLNPGSYVPYFRAAQSGPSQPGTPATDAAAPAEASRSRLWSYAALAVLAGACVFSLVWLLFFRPSVTDQFWAPILKSPARVTLCVGSPDAVGTATRDLPPAASVYEDLQRSGRLGTANVVTLIRLAGPLENHHKDFRLELASQASFPELREGPVVLVGALDNAWTVRLTEPLRYGFAMDENTMSIVDHKNPATTRWSVSLKQAPSSLPSDFAIIARYQDATLDQPVVLAAGLSREGTEAAGEILSNPALLRTLFQNAPRNWSTVNLEAVVQTQVIEGHPGPSRVVAVEYW